MPAPRSPSLCHAVLVCLCALVSLSCASAAAAGSKSKKIDVKQCKAWGFTGDAKCSDCDSLMEFVHVSECKQCCVKDEQASVKYVSVELQVSTGRIHALPEVKHFVEKMSHKYGKLIKIDLKAASSVGARLKCRKPEGGFDFIRVDNWKRDSFEDFMKDRVQQPASSDA